MPVNLEGPISPRPSAQPGQGPPRILKVVRFVAVHPGKGFPSAIPGASLRGDQPRL